MVEGRTSAAMYERKKLPGRSVPHRPYTLSPYDAGWIIEDVWPTLYWGRECVREIRRKVAKLSWALEIVETMRREAELLMSAPPQVPMEQCGWRHDFYSRRTGAHLLYEPHRPDAFLDPTTGERESDGAQRRAWALLTHERTFRIMRSLGVLYQVDFDERYARWVREGLLRACEYFGHTEFHRSSALYFQSLYDASMLGLLANAYDLVRDSTVFSPSDHRRIEREIFEERLGAVAEFGGRGAANMDCFVAMALVTAGSALGRPEWLRTAQAEGLTAGSQLRRGVLGETGGDLDGFWREGSMFYHLYALCGLVSVVEHERRTLGRVDGDTWQRFRAMFDTPPALADQQFRLPTLGDLGDPDVMNLAAYRHLYEYAAGRIDYDRFGPLLATLYRACGAPRTDLAALAFGPDELPEPAPSRQGVSRLQQAGIGVFRSESPEQMYVMFRNGTYRGGHDHPDRLSVVLHGCGMPISSDPGGPGYSLNEATGNYFRSTIAHNTVLVDEQDQCDGAAHEWHPAADPPWGQGTVSHDGCQLRRTVVFEPPHVTLIDDFAGDEARRFAWLFHVRGDLLPTGLDLVDDPTTHGWDSLPQTGPWSMLCERQYGVATHEVECGWRVSDDVWLNLRTKLDTAHPVQVVVARTPSQPFGKTDSLLMLRTRGPQSRLRTVLELRRYPADMHKAHDHSD